MKKTFLPWLAGLVVCALLLELLLRVLPVNSGPRMINTSADQPERRFLPDQDYVYSFGWAFGNVQRGRSNAMGFNHSPDHLLPRGILVLGDSYIEAQMMATPDTLEGRLDAAFPGRVTSVAASANGLADHLENALIYAPRFHPADVVMEIESGDMSDLLAPAQGGHTGFIDNAQGVHLQAAYYQESPLKNKLSKSALFRYLYYNIKINAWRPTEFKKLLQPAAPLAPDAGEAARKRRVLQYFFDGVAALQKSDGFKTFYILDADRNAIYRPRDPAHYAWDTADRALFKSMAIAAGMQVIDMQPAFANHWLTTREKVDFSPMDYHWNRAGHALVARQLIPLLR